jgi:hypothetical protein
MASFADAADCAWARGAMVQLCSPAILAHQIADEDRELLM